MPHTWFDRIAGCAHRGLVPAVVATCLLAFSSSRAADVTLVWDPSSAPDVVGYHIYYGVASRVYTNMVAVGDVTNVTISGLIAGTRYYFAGTAIDSVGLESDFSEEISYQVPSELLVKGASLTRTYGATNPVLSGTVTGLKAGDNITVTYSTAATAGSPVGTYAIIPKLVDPSGRLTNYTVTLQSGALTVLPAPLTITAKSATMVSGSPVPPLAATYHGFVNGETTASLESPAVVTTPANVFSLAGMYPIIPAGAAGTNYAISYVNGTLMVEASPATPALNLGILNLNDGTVMVGGFGVANASYVIEYRAPASAAGDWVILGTVVADSNGLYTLVDTVQPGVKLYRAHRR